MPAADDVDPRVAAALRTQLRWWRDALRDGADRIGWKIGLGIAEVGDELGREEPVIGHLTSATLLPSGATYRARGAADLRVDCEVALDIGRDVGPDADAGTAREAIAGLGAALELVDVGRPPDDLEGIVGANVFHRAVVLGHSRPAGPIGGAEARTIVNGQLRDSARAPDDFAGTVCAVARLLGAAGERLQARDRIIAGSLTQVPVGPGDEVVAEIDGLGRLQVAIA
jgi:2-keto-4-pentenoate hydratase